MKKKLLVFHPALAPYRVDFFNALNDHFDAEFLFTNANLLEQDLDQQLLSREINFVPTYLLRGFEVGKRSFRFGIIRSLKIHKPEAVFCSEYGPVTLMVFFYRLLTRDKFKIYTLSDDSIDNAKSRKGLRSFFRNFILKNINGVFFPSEEVCNWHKVNISPTINTLTLPIIHNDKIFRNKIASSLEKAKENVIKYNINNKKIILYVGRLVEVKNLPYLLRAVSQLKIDDWILVLVGSGDDEESLKHLSFELKINDNVLFIGHREGPDLYAWYSIGQIFVLPSTFEPYGAVVNEALLSGCYVFCSELAGASSLICPKNGMLLDPYNVNYFTENLEHRLQKVPLIAIDNFILRKNNMPFSFIDKVENLIAKL